MANFSKKICLLGPPSVGKTSLIRRYVHDTFSDEYLSTIGAKPTSKTLEVERTVRKKREPRSTAELPAYAQSPSPQPQPYSQPVYPGAYPSTVGQSQTIYPPQTFALPPQAQPEPQPSLGFFRRLWTRISGGKSAKQPSPMPQSFPYQYQPHPAESGGFQPQPLPDQAPPTSTEPEFEETVEKVKLTLLIWDIAGQLEQERPTKLHEGFYRGAEGALLVSDCSRRATIEAMPAWVENFYRVVGRVPVIFIGNKSDLVPPDSLAEVDGLLKDLAERYEAKHIITSTRTGSGVEESFKTLGTRMFK